MSIKFRDNNEGKLTKEELRLHLIEDLLSKRFTDYNNTELQNSIYNDNGCFNKIYHKFNEWIFNE